MRNQGGGYMKELIKIEMKRAARSKSFYVSLGVGLMITIAHIFMIVYERALNPLKFFHGGMGQYPYSVFNSWIGGGYSPNMTVYLTLFPILATLPFALTYSSDIKSGYTKNIFTRTKKINYYVSKYIATFVFGGLAVVIPMIMNLMITVAMLPALKPVGNGTFTIAVYLWSDIFYKNPFLYIFMFMIVYFIYGGVFASIALAGHYLVDNIFLLTILPFIIYYSLGIISSYLLGIEWLRSISPSRMLNISNSYTTELSLIGVAVIIGVICFAIFLRKGVKDDTL